MLKIKWIKTLKLKCIIKHCNHNQLTIKVSFLFATFIHKTLKQHNKNIKIGSFNPWFACLLFSLLSTPLLPLNGSSIDLLECVYCTGKWSLLRLSRCSRFKREEKEGKGLLDWMANCLFLEIFWAYKME